MASARSRRKEKEENFRRVERSTGSFTRSFTLPVPWDLGQVSAHYDKGVLKINLPRRPRPKPKQIKVNVGARRPSKQGSRQGRVNRSQ